MPKPTTRQHIFTKISLGKLNEQEYFLQLPKRRGLVLSGGGAKCIAYAGMIHYMAQANYLDDITHIAGTSAGGIIGSFIAFGVTPDDLAKIMLKTNHNLLRYEPKFIYPVSGDRTRAYLEIIYQTQLTQLLPESHDIEVQHQSIWTELKTKMDTFKIYFAEQPFNLFHYDDFLALEANQYQLIDDIFNNFKPSDFISFRDLDNLRILLSNRKKNIIKDLSIAVADLTIQETKVYSVRKTPDDSISLAVQISSAHPVLYKYTFIDGHQLSDGGYFDNMPVSLLYQIEEENFSREDILCVRADADEDFAERYDKSLLASPEKVDTLVAEIWDWMTGAESMTARSINAEKQFSFGNMLYINTSDVSTTSVDITEDERKQLLHSAFIQTAQFFNKSRIVYNNPVLPLLRLTEASLLGLSTSSDFPELLEYIPNIKAIKIYQELIIMDLKLGEHQFITQHIQAIIEQINDIQKQQQKKSFQHLSLDKDDSILNMVLEQINHTSEGRYTEFLEFKEHEFDSIFHYLLWYILRFLQLKFGFFTQDDKYTSPFLERAYVLEHTKQLLTH